MPTTGKGAATSAAILDAARARFARDGYERTTIRAVAGDVGVDPALVLRYFGSKDALFAEAAEFRLRLPDLTGVAPDDLAAALMPHFFAVWEQDTGFLSLLRASVSNPAAAKRMRAIFARQVAPALAVVVPDRPAERAALVGSQIIGLAVSRLVLKVPPVVGMSREQLIAWVGPTLRAYLVDDLPDV